MKHLYYEIFDTTMEFKNPNHSHFWHLPLCNDFAGALTAFAKKHGIDTSKARMFFYEKRTQWEEAQTRWLNQVDWSIPLIP